MSLSSKMLRGAMTLAAARIAGRILTLVSLLTVARWLGPTEVGVFAIATLAITALEQLSETGFRSALIHQRGDIRQYLAPVRTVQAVRGLGLGALMFITAPWTAGLFDSPQALEILRVLSLVPVIQGVEPLFETLSRKDLRFGTVASVQIASGIVGLLVAITAAWARPTAWALVYSAIARVTASTVCYYSVSERSLWRFSLNWGRLRELHPFGFWIFVTGVLSYLFVKGGDWAIGCVLSTQELALYQMAFLICTTLTSELAAVLNTMLFPLFSKVQPDPGKLADAFGFSFGAVAVATFFMGALICACSEDLFTIVLGPAWSPALSLVPWLTAWGVCSALGSVLGSFMQALGRPKTWAITIFWMSGLLGVGVYPATVRFGVEGVAALLAGIGVIMQLIRYRIVTRMLGWSFGAIARRVLVPTVAGLVGVLFASWGVGLITNAGTWQSLVLKGLGTAGIYGLFVWTAGARLQPSVVDLARRIRPPLAVLDKPGALTDPIP